MNILIKNCIFVVCCTLLSAQCLAQNRSKANQPPWVIGKPSAWQAGELPQIDLQGNLLKISFSEGKTKEAARVSAEKQFVQNINNEAGTTISRNDNIQGVFTERINDRKAHYDNNIRYEQNVTINGKTFARYAVLDEYYEYANGAWHSAILYLLAENNMSLANVPPITYDIDRGAWRSLIIPGWSQMYTGRTTMGITFLTVEAGLIGGAFYTNYLADYYKKRQNEAYSISIKKDYKKKYDQMVSYRNIAAGAAAAWYVWNVIDAFTQKRGKLYYTRAYGQSQISVVPVALDENKLPTLGFTCNINF